MVERDLGNAKHLNCSKCSHLLEEEVKNLLLFLDLIAQSMFMFKASMK